MYNWKDAARVLAAAAIGGTALLGLGSVAGASTPANHGNRNVATFALTCANGVSGNAVVHKRLPTTRHHPDRWFVLHMASGRPGAKVFVSTSLDVTFTFTDAKGNVTTTTENISKKAHVRHTTTCTLTGTRSVDGGTLAVAGTATGAFH